MKDLEKLLKALANRRRLAILKYLKERSEASVGDIAEAIHVSFPATSKHLARLSALDIIDREQRGLHMFYFLNKDQKFIVQRILSLL